MTQLALIDCTGQETPTGTVYWMTDGYLIKVGYTARGIRQRAGELRATVISSGPGTREDERALQATLKMWCVGGEWFRLPDRAGVLSWLRGQIHAQGGDAALRMLDRVIASNLRRAA